MSTKMNKLAIAARVMSDGVKWNWPFGPRHYPRLAEARSVHEVLRFCAGHMALHLMKEAGILARIEERAQHRRGANLPKREWARVKKLAMKSIVSGFRLFMLAGGQPDELVAYIKKIKTKRPAP